MVYIDIERVRRTSGTWSLNLYKFTTGQEQVETVRAAEAAQFPTARELERSPSDILEPNDATTTASPATLLPSRVQGSPSTLLRTWITSEIDMISGTTYYVNITFVHANGDIDVGWDTASGTFLDKFRHNIGNVESLQVTATANQTTYLDVYGYSGATNTYDIEITTDNPGGGQSGESFETVDVCHPEHDPRDPLLFRTYQRYDVQLQSHLWTRTSRW